MNTTWIIRLPGIIFLIAGRLFGHLLAPGEKQSGIPL